MFGIVLWTNTETGDALIWCEDQKDLAFLEFATLKADNLPSLRVDDQMVFELEQGTDVRKIAKVFDLWAPENCHSLVDVLQGTPRLRAG